MVRSTFTGHKSTFMLFLMIGFLFWASSSLGSGYDVGHCKPSSDSCSFYSCAEDEFNCGPQGYFQKIARRLCQPKGLSNRADAEVQNFSRLVRKCLQKQVVRLAPYANSCSAMQELALDSHVSCFVAAGFCDLNAAQRMNIFKNPFQFLKISGPQKMIAMSNQIFATCRAKKNLPRTSPTSEVGL